MQNSKLFELFRSLSFKEVKKFDKYICSPFFNEDEVLVSLTHFLTHTPLGNEDDEDLKVRAFQFMYSGNIYDDLKMRHTMADLLRHLETFLTFSVNGEERLPEKIKLMETYRERGLYKHFVGTLRHAESIQNKNPYRDAAYFYHQFNLENEKNQYLAVRYERTKELDLKAAADNLDTFYLISKLKTCCEMLNYRNIVDIDSEILLLDEILNYIRDNEEEAEPAIEIYYKILMTLNVHVQDQAQEGTDELEPELEQDRNYNDLKQLLEKHASKFSQEEARDMYAYAQNYCIKKINKGESAYLYEIFYLYKDVLEKEIIFENKLLSPWDYKNIVTAGLRIEEFEWVQKFIHKYKESIAESFRSNAFTYNLAKYYFATKAHDKVLGLLQEVEYEDVFYGLDSRTMLMKTYFEVGEIISLDYLLDSFRIYLRRNKLISETHRKNYLNLIKFTKKLAKLKGAEKWKIVRFKKELERTEQIADVDWLMEQLRVVEKNS